MAGGSIKGITIQIGADTTKLSSALNSANRAIKETQSSLTAVNKALKFDPTNVNLLRDKHNLLKDKIGEVKDKLDALKQAQSQLDASGVDKNSKEYKELQREIDLAEAELKQLNKETKKFGSEGAQAIAAVGEKLKTVGSKITEIGKGMTAAVTVPLVAAGTVAVNKFAEVDKTMQLTNATMGNTEDQAKLLNQAMKDAASNSTFGMNDAATATLNFARAGLSAEQAAAALAPAMNLAAGEGGNLDTVSAGLVATINGFGGSFDDASKYADVFANACNNSALDVDSLSQAMSVAAPIFKTAGYSVNDAALYMGVMANAGIDANTAANALKTGMARLVKPAKEGQEWMDKLGISVTNADGSMKDSITVQAELNKAFSGLSESEQIAAASAIFGKNQMSNWLALINTAPGDVSKLNSALQEEGTTTEMANAMMSGFGGSIEKLKSSVDVAATSFGEALAPTISKVADVVQKAVDWFNGLSDSQREMIAKVALVVAAIGPLLMILGQVISVVGTIMTLAPAIGTALTVMTGPVGLVVAAIAAVIAIGVALYKNWDTIKAKCAEIGNAIKEKWNSMKESISTAVDNAKTAVSQKWDEMKNKIANSQLGQVAGKVWDAVKTTTSNSLSAIKSAYDKHGGGLKGAVSATLEGVKQYYTAGYNFVDNLTGGKLSNMLNTVKGKMSDIANQTSQKLENVKSYFSNKLADAANTANTKLENVKSYFTTKLSDAANTASTKLENVKSYFAGKMTDAANTAQTKLENIKSYFTTKLADAANTASTKLENVKSYFSAKMADAANTAQTKLDNIKSYFSTKMSDAANTASTKLESIKGYFSSKMGDALSTVQTKLDTIKSAFSEKLSAAYETVKGIIQKIKDLFDISLKLDIKLPHISVSGGEAPYGIGGKGKLPSFSVEWYDKGGIFNSPTIIGVGEKRPEFVGALDDLRQIVREEAGSVGGDQLLKTMNTMVSLMATLVDQNSKARAVTVNQTINANETSYAEQQRLAARQFKEIARLI